MRDRTVLILALSCLVGLALALTALDATVEESGTDRAALALDFLDRLIMIGSAVGSTMLVLRLTDLRRRTDDLEGAVHLAAKEGRAWRAQSRRFLDGLSRAVEAQFDAWSLTPAEADVAGLLLKGASLREIAGLRRTSEATIRQQAQSIYRKSGLGSRAELSAYFMEDLFTLGEATLTAAQGTVERYDA
ncbi:MAG: helix-turn-helix transcriptional regulator [Gemmobacter sp.]